MWLLLVTFTACAGLGLWAGTRERQEVGRFVPKRGTVSSPQADGWEQPDNGGIDNWQNEGGLPDVPDPDPETSFKAARASYAWSLGFGRKLQCPKCAAIDQERTKAGLDPLPKSSFSRRARDSALRCDRCQEAFYPMSEDTVMKYDPRFHRQRPDDQQEAA